MSKKALLIYRELSKVAPYTAALGKAGLNVEIVAANGSVRLGDFTGLVLVGGTDVDPSRYGESPHPETDTPDGQRDEIECSLIREALDRDAPILAICRGLQILNVCHGGSLIQHLPTSDRHRQTTGDRGQPVHEVSIDPGTLLADVSRARRWRVNSRHHQAVKRVGKGLRVSALDPEDGTVEALERPDRQFVLGVQWHPEDQTTLDPEQGKIFQSFAGAVLYNSKTK